MSDFQLEAEAEPPVIVIDNGSGFTKAGFAGETTPSAVFPSIVGKLRHYDSCWGSAGLGARTRFAGDEAHQKRGILHVKHPVEHGIITNWDDMEELWKHTLFGVLKVPPEEHPVLLTEVPFNTKENREKMAEIMFEAFMVHSLNIATQPELALLVSSRTTGVVVESGDGVTHVVPIHNEHPIQEAIIRLDLGGRDLTSYFMQLVTLTDYYALTNAERDRGRQAKEALCYTALNYQNEMGRGTADPGSLDKTYILSEEMPPLTLGKQRFMVAEAMFDPRILGLEGIGIHPAVHNAIIKCPTEIRTELYANVVLSGGNTCFPGFAERLRKELVALSRPLDQKEPETLNVNVIAPADRQHSAWFGGSLFASRPEFRSSCMTREEYQETGTAALHSKVHRQLSAATD